MTAKLISPANVRGSRRRWLHFGAPLAIIAGSASVGCQTVFPGAAPGSFALGEDRRIAKQAAAEKFPSPADVGIETPTSVP
jgi:hypothetical protein